jgi:hypothetical protein
MPDATNGLGKPPNAMKHDAERRYFAPPIAVAMSLRKYMIVESVNYSRAKIRIVFREIFFNAKA